MTSLISARRAAEDFARVVDGSQQDVADRYADLTATVALLRRHEVPAARSEFVADLRAQLMSAADTLLVPADDHETGREPGTAVPLRPARQRRLAVAAAAFVVVGGTAGVAAAAEGSLPGDALYPIKRGIESAQVSLNTSDAGKGQDLLAQGGTRLDEISGLVGHGDAAGQIADTLASYQRSVADGSNLLFVAYQRDPSSSDLAQLRDTISAQRTRLRDLAGRAPASSQPDFRSASALLSDIDQQARVMCSNCGPDSSGSGFADNASAPTLESLFNASADAAAAQEQKDVTQALAQKATQLAAETPKATTPTTSSSGIVSTTRDGSGQVLPGVSVPAVTSPTGALTSTVTTVTGTVQGLVDSVSTTTGLPPLTDTVTGTVKDVTGLLGSQ